MIDSKLSPNTIAFLDEEQPRDRQEIKELIECDYEEYFESIYDNNNPILMAKITLAIDNLVQEYIDLKNLKI